MGDTHILAGLNVARVEALRDDLAKEFRYRDGFLELPAGESKESILGTVKAASLVVALGIPVSLRASFGQAK